MDTCVLINMKYIYRYDVVDHDAPMCANKHEIFIYRHGVVNHNALVCANKFQICPQA